MVKNIRFGLIIILVFLLAGCKLPASGITPPATNAEIKYTQAVETVSAELTKAVDVKPTKAVQTATSSTEDQTTTQVVETKAPDSIDAPTATATLEQAVVNTPESTATPAATSTPTVKPTDTLPTTDPRTGLGSPDFEDNFDNAENWPLYIDKHGSFEIKDARLLMTAFRADFYNSWMLSWPKLEDFYLEATFSAAECAGRDRYGLMFRAPDATQGYLFGFSCDGRYSLWYWDGKSEIDVVDWTESKEIVVGVDKVNRMGVKAQGNKIWLYANGILLKEIQNSAYDSGNFGVFIGSANTEDFEASVDKIEYWELE